MYARGLDKLFTGKQRNNNIKILEYMLEKNEPVSKYQISNNFDKRKYSTYFGRVNDLERRGVIEVKGKTKAQKTGNEIPLYGISHYGMVLASLELEGKARKHALNLSKERILDCWNKFCEIYELDESKIIRTRKYWNEFKEWLESDEAPKDLLEMFGAYPFFNETEAILTFRLMIDLGLILNESAKLAEGPPGIGIKIFHIQLLGFSILEFDRFQKLVEVMKKVDKPLHEFLQKKPKNNKEELEK